MATSGVSTAPALSVRPTDAPLVPTQTNPGPITTGGSAAGGTSGNGWFYDASGSGTQGTGAKYPQAGDYHRVNDQQAAAAGVIGGGTPNTPNPATPSGGTPAGGGTPATGTTQVQATPQANAVDPNSIGAVYTADNGNGGNYYVGTDAGVSFIDRAENGSSITGGDGSVWTKGSDGTVTITTKDGQTFTVKGSSVSPQADKIKMDLPQPEDYFNNGKKYLDSIRDNAIEQQKLQNQYAVNQGVTELQRAEEDARQQFDTARNQASRDEQIGLDNQALYAEARGDKGGIGQAQYAAIQAQAAQSRMAVNQAQTKLSTDTARQIADLRAQGAFKEADALLTITQSYLGQIMDLYQNSMAYGLSFVQLQTQIQQWEAEYNLKVAQLTGKYNGAPTYEAQQNMASMAMQMLSSGMGIGDDMKNALKSIYGMTDADIDTIKMQAQLGIKGSGGGGNPVPDDAIREAKLSDDPVAWLIANGYTNPADAVAALLRADKGTFSQTMDVDTDGDGIPDTQMTLAQYYAGQYSSLPEKDRMEYMWDNGFAPYPQIDDASVLRLGYGPISYEMLAQLETQGDVYSKLESDGRLHFYPVQTGKNKNNLPFDMTAVRNGPLPTLF